MMRKFLSMYSRTVTRDKGDTLVEVLLAIAVLSLVAVGSMAVMNRGNGLIQSALERTGVRAEINSQSEMLNYVRDNKPTLWQAIKQSTVSEAAAKDNTCKATTGKSFYLDFANVETVSVPSKVTVDTTTGLAINKSGRATYDQAKGGGLWGDAVYYPTVVNGNQEPYFDFYIKACWTPIGSSSGNVSKSITIVRIYDNE